MSVPHTKLTRTVLRPSEEEEVISSTPGTVATISSMIWVTSRSITSGLAPSYSVRMRQRRQLDVGQQVDLQPAQGDGPQDDQIRVTMVVKIGRLTLNLGRFIGGPPFRWRTAGLSGAAGIVIGGAVVYQLLAEGDDPAGQPLAFHLNPVAVADAHFYFAPGDRSPLRIDDEHTAPVVTDGQRLLRDDGGIRHLIQHHRQPG